MTALTLRARLAPAVRWALVLLVLGVCVKQVVTSFNWSEIAITLHGSEKEEVILAVALAPLFWVFRALRLQILLHMVTAKQIPLLDLYLATACSSSIAALTPMQAGEATKIELLRRLNALPRIEGYGAFAVERLVDFITLVALTSFAVAVSGLDRFKIVSLPVLIAVAGAVVAIALLATWWLYARSPWRHRYSNRFAIQESLQRVPLVLALSCLAWLVTALSWTLCWQAIGVDVALLEATSAMGLVTLVSVLSMVPGAIGVSELGISIALATLGHAGSAAQTGAIAIRLYGLLLIALSVMHFPLFALYARRRLDAPAA